MAKMNTGERGVGRPAAVLGGAVLVGLLGAAAVPAAEPNVARNVEAFAPVPAVVFNGDLRDLPKAPDWEPGDPIKEIPRRSTKVPAAVPEPTPAEDPLRGIPASKSPNAIGPPILNFNGGAFTGVSPPDTVGDVGPLHFIQLINFGSGSQMRIYDKNTGTLVAGPIVLDQLGLPAPCNAGLGDPIVLWDQLANRWLVSEFSTSGNRMCVYISQTTDPIAGGWFGYAMQGASFPDYPKYGVWPDAYYVGTNEGTAAAYAMQRPNMLVGAAAALQRFAVTPPLNFGFEGIQPADADGALAPPAGAPGTFWRHNDSESHGNPGGPDNVQYYEFHVDFATPANSTFTGPVNIAVTEFDSNLCGLVSFNCFAQPGSGVTLDPLREPVMHRAQYRNRGTHEVLVGSFVIDTTGTNVGGVRWFEMRKTPPGVGPFTLFQEGTVSPDNTNRWMSSIAMDGSGNIALGYNVVNATTATFPGLRYTGRVSTDPAGTMAVEQLIFAGTASSSTNRYGDYSSLSVDPVNECTFWWTGEYNAAASWSTRIATFTFPVPECIPVPVALQDFTVE